MPRTSLRKEGRMCAGQAGAAGAKTSLQHGPRRRVGTKAAPRMRQKLPFPVHMAGPSAGNRPGGRGGVSAAGPVCCSPELLRAESPPSPLRLFFKAEAGKASRATQRSANRSEGICAEWAWLPRPLCTDFRSCRTENVVGSNFSPHKDTPPLPPLTFTQLWRAVNTSQGGGGGMFRALKMS